MIKSVLAFALLVAFVTAPARADCDHFKWSLAREMAWFATAPEPVDAGGQIALAEQAFTLTLKPNDAVSFPMPLQKPPTAGTFGGFARVADIPKAGLYEVTLSREAWVDVVQNQTRAKSRNVSRQRDCPSLRKSVRFQLNAGPAALQFSGVDAATITFALASAP